MDHRNRLIVRHDRARYPQRRGRPTPRTALTGLLVVLLAGLLVASTADARPRSVRANGRWASFHVRAPGGHHAFLFPSRAGARYRITLQPGSLERPWMELLWGAQAEAPVRTLPGKPGEEVELIWSAESDSVAEVRVRGFSAATGKGKLKIETIDPSGKKVKPGERFLAVVPAEAPDGTKPKYQVGDLLLGETNEWNLLVEPGRAYEVRTSKGTAGGIRLRVVNGGASDVAHSDAWRQAGIHFPTLRFRVPALSADARPPKVGTWRLIVEGVWSSAGTYGLRLTELPADAGIEPQILAPVPTVERGLVDASPLTFQLEEGDMAVLWVPQANLLQHRRIQMQLRGKWMFADGRGGGTVAHGDFAAGRRPGSGHFYSFRPYQPGTYRFTGLGRRAQSPAALETLKVYSRDTLGPAPVHMGTNADPSDKARPQRKWAPIGMGICVPGVTYLFVARDAAAVGTGMRVRTLDGKTIATRHAIGGTWPTAPGYGPSMRFQVPSPMVVRLEAKGGRRIVRALLRELKSD